METTRIRLRELRLARTRHRRQASVAGGYVSAAEDARNISGG
jgi:hypothetical protein